MDSVKAKLVMAVRVAPDEFHLVDDWRGLGKALWDETADKDQGTIMRLREMW